MAHAEYNEYRKFLEDFAASVDPADQLPVKVAGYTLTEAELTGEIIDWTTQYLADKKCPSSLVTPILRIILEETKQTYRKTPEMCGYKADVNAYQPLKLMQTVIAKVNDVCQRLLDNAQLDAIPSPPPTEHAAPRYAVSAIKNSRRKMEDRHVVIDDFNGVFGIDTPNRASYYAVFDGHAGVDAANYAVSHLHYHLATSPHYPDHPAEAMRDAFHITDTDFLRKSEKLKLVSSGSTALCALYRPVEQRIYVGWLGDSKAMLVTQGTIMPIVRPHKPELPSEKERIRELGGTVMMYAGLYRVNGALAVSRSIGDPAHRPYISGEPDIISVPLNGNEDFLILGCDGLWDHVTEDDVAFFVYKQVRENPENLDQVTKRLTELSVIQGSTDNISVIVVFLKDPHKISTSSWPSAVIPSALNMDTAYDNNTNEDIFQKPNLMHDYGLDMDFKGTLAPNVDATGSIEGVAISKTDDLNNVTDLDDEVTVDTIASDSTKHPIDFIFGNGSTHIAPTNGNSHHDLGLETDVDSVDEAVLLGAQVTPIGDFISEFVHKNGDEMRSTFEDRNDNIKEEDEDFLKDELNGDHEDNHLLVNETEEVISFASKINTFDPFSHGDHHIEDNKFLDTVQEDGDFQQDAVELLVDSSKKVIDFSEKKEFSFEREEFEKEVDSLADVQSAMQEAFDDADRADEDAASVRSDVVLAGSPIPLDSSASPNPLDSSADDEGIEVNAVSDDVAAVQLSAGFGESLTVNDLQALSINDDDEEEVIAEPEIKIGLDSFIVPEADHEPSADHAAAENVVVPESGEDSEDEWNYIQVPKETTDANPLASLDSGKPHVEPEPLEPEATEQELIAVEPESSAVENELATQLENTVIDDIAETAFENTVIEKPEFTESEFENTVIDKHELLESPFEPTNLQQVHDDTPLSPVSVPESHAVAQALAESHEEVQEHHDDEDDQHHAGDEHQDALEPELLQLEANASGATIDSSLATLDTTPVVSTDIDADAEEEEDMDSQLNPDAKEFVPIVSPQRTPTSSPLGNSENIAPLRRPELRLDDDCVLAQSPRKGGTPMENITIPTELDFDNEIANCPKEVEEENFHDDSNGVPSTPPAEIANGNDRPGSSSSQYSYQEMNLKEAMHGDEKQEYAPEDAIVSPVAGTVPTDDISAATDPLSDVTNESKDDHVNDKFLRESDPMSMSFYNDGSSGTGNPFAVDMNAVQVLPVDDDEDDHILEHIEKPYHFEGQEGQHFVIEDTEFGMNGGRLESPLEVPDEVSKPEEDQYSPVIEHKDFQQDTAHFESDQPEADSQPTETSSIVQVVQEMASEVTSLLDDFSLNDSLKPQAVDEPVHHEVSSDVNEGAFKEYEENVSDVTATPTDDVAVQDETPFEDLAEAEQNYSQVESTLTAVDVEVVQSPVPSEPEIVEVAEEPKPSQIEEAVEELVVKSVAPVEAETSAPLIADTIELSEETVQERVDHTLSKVLGGDVVALEDETPVDVAPINVDGAAADVVAQAAERLQSTGSASPTTLVPKKPAASSAKTSTTPKKPEPKTTTKATSTLTKKPTTSTSTLASRSVAAAKPATKPPTSRPLTSTTTATARPRSVQSSTLTSTKAPVSLAAKKPVPNGEAKSSSSLLTKKTTTTTSTVTKSASAPKPLTKPASATTRAPIASRPASLTASKSSTATPRPTPSSTITKTSITSSTRAPISRAATTTATAKPRLTTTTTAAAPKSARPSNGLSPTKPTVATSKVNTLSTARTSAISSNATQSARPSTTTPKKTIDASTKSPSARPIVKSTIPPAKRTTATSLTTTSSSTLAAAKKTPTTTATLTSLAPVKRCSVPSPIKKRISTTTSAATAATVVTTTTATTVITNGTSETEVKTEQFITDSTQIINSIDESNNTIQPAHVIDLIDD